jgi:hypothetical protein
MTAPQVTQAPAAYSVGPNQRSPFESGLRLSAVTLLPEIGTYVDTSLDSNDMHEKFLL